MSGDRILGNRQRVTVTNTTVTIAADDLAAPTYTRYGRLGHMVSIAKNPDVWVYVTADDAEKIATAWTDLAARLRQIDQVITEDDDFFLAGL